MKTIFDKIYVINLVENIKRKKFIEYEFKKYGLKFEFIHTPDFYNLFDKYKEEIFNIYDLWGNKINLRLLGCTLGNYMAVKQAYEFGYNNVLVIEDDICFTKNKQLLEYYLNNVPKNADVIRYAFRCIDEDNLSLIESIHKDNYNNDYLLVGKDVPNNKIQYCGTSMWAIMNRQTMKKYIDSITNKFLGADQIDLFFTNMQNNDFNIYLSNKCLNVEILYYAYLQNNEIIPVFYRNPFINDTDKKFYKPRKLEECFTIFN